MDSGERVVMNYTEASLRSKTAEFVVVKTKGSAPQAIPEQDSGVVPEKESKVMLEKDIKVFADEATKPYDKAVAEAEKRYPTETVANDSGDTKHVLSSVQIANNEFKLNQAKAKAAKTKAEALSFSMELNGKDFPEDEDGVDSKAVFAQPLTLVDSESKMTLNKMTLKNAGVNFFRFAVAAFSGKLEDIEEGIEAVVELADSDSKSVGSLEFIKDFATKNILALNLQKLDDRGMAFVAELKKVQGLPKMMIANAKMSINDLIPNLFFERAELVVAKADALSSVEDTPAAVKIRSFTEAVNRILGVQVNFKGGLSMSIEDSKDASSDASGFVKSALLGPDSKGVSASFGCGDFSGLVSAVSALKSGHANFRVGDYARPDDSDLHKAFNAALDLAGDDFGLDAAQIAKLKGAVMLETGFVNKEEALRLLTDLDEYNNSGSAASCTIS